MKSKQGDDNRLKIIVGHYGSGKTEFAVNYALMRSETGRKVLLADLDVVNPYFRARDHQERLLGKGIMVIGGLLKEDIHTDIPSLSPRLFSIFGNTEQEAVVDVGGDPVGARVLGRFHPYLMENPYEMWMVVNSNRPGMKEAGQVIGYMEEIEKSSRLKISGIVSNTHLMGETSISDIEKGYRLCLEVRRRTGVNLRYLCAEEDLISRLHGVSEGELLPVRMHIRPGWLQGGDFHAKREN